MYPPLSRKNDAILYWFNNREAGAAKKIPPIIVPRLNLQAIGAASDAAIQPIKKRVILREGREIVGMGSKGHKAHAPRALLSKG